MLANLVLHSGGGNGLSIQDMETFHSHSQGWLDTHDALSRQLQLRQRNENNASGGNEMQQPLPQKLHGVGI